MDANKQHVVDQTLRIIYEGRKALVVVESADDVKQIRDAIDARICKAIRQLDQIKTAGLARLLAIDDERYETRDVAFAVKCALADGTAVIVDPVVFLRALHRTAL